MMTDEPLPIAAGATQVMVEFSMQLRPCVIRRQLGGNQAMVVSSLQLSSARDCNQAIRQLGEAIS